MALSCLVAFVAMTGSPLAVSSTAWNMPLSYWTNNVTYSLQTLFTPTRSHCYSYSVDVNDANASHSRMHIQQHVGKNIRKLRKLRGLSQEELGFLSGLHRTYISGLERGIRNPSLQSLQAIAIALDVLPRQLLD